MDRLALFSALSSFCRDELEEESASLQQLKGEDIWKTIYQIAKENPQNLYVLFPLLSQYAFANPTFREITPPQIEESLALLQNEDITDEERLNAAKPLFVLLPYISTENTRIIISCFIDIVDKHFTSTSDIPKKILDLIGTIESSALHPNVFENLYDDLQQKYLESPKCAAALLVVGGLITNILEICEDSSEFISELLIKGIKGERKLKIAILYMTERLTHGLIGDKGILVPEFFPLLAELFISGDVIVCFRAHKAMRQLVEIGIFDDAKAAKVVIDQFQNYQEARYPLFFKLIQRFLDDNETAQLDVVQIMYDFIDNTLKSNTNVFVVSHCLETLSLIAAINKMYIEDIYQKAVQIGIDYINSSEKSAFTPITNSFLAVSKSFPESSSKINEIVPILVNSLTDEESGTKKARMERAESLASILPEHADKEHISKIISFTLSSLQDLTGSELYYVCSVVLALRKQLQQETAIQIYQKMEHIAYTETVSQKLNAVLHTMLKLLKIFDIDATQIIKDICSGKIAFLADLPPYTCQDTKTMIFTFIATYIRKNPMKSGAICTEIVNWIPEIRFAMLPAALEPVEAGLHAGIISVDISRELYATIIGIIDKLMPSDDEELCACFEILSQILRNAPQVIDIPTVFNHIGKILGVNVEEEDDDEVNLSESNMLPILIRFVFEMYTLQLIKVDVNPTLLEIILHYLPLDATLGGMSDILQLLQKMLEDGDRFNCIKLDAVVMIADLLMKKKSDLDLYGFNPQLITSVKLTCKKILKADKQLEKQVAKQFQSSRQTLNRYNSLFK